MSRLIVLGIGLSLVVSAGCKRADEPARQTAAARSAPPAATPAKGATERPTLAPPARADDIEAAARYEIGPRVTEMTAQLADAIESNAGDCDGMADAVTDLLSQRTELLGQMQASRGTAEQRAWTRVNAAAIESTTTRLEKMAPCLEASPKLLDSIATLL